MRLSRAINPVSFVVILLLSTVVDASSVNNVYITHVVVQKENASGGDRVCVYPSETVPNPPSCSTMNRYCTDLNGPIGQGILSIALTAQASKQLVRISGEGTCQIISNSEDITFILLKSS